MRASRLDERERRREHERQLQQQGRDQQDHAGDRRIRRGEQEHRRERRGTANPASAAADTGNTRRRTRFRRDRRQRIAREDVTQRAEHRHDRGEHPATGGDRDALPRSRRAASRPRTPARRKPGRSESRWIDSSSPSANPERAGDQAQHEPVDQQHRDHRARGVAVAAQVGDQPPSLRDGEQRRVEREQEPDQRADRGEQRARLVARRRGLGEQLFVVVGRSRRSSGRRRAPPSAARTLVLRARAGRHEDAAHAAVQAGHFLCE